MNSGKEKKKRRTGQTEERRIEGGESKDRARTEAGQSRERTEQGHDTIEKIATA